MFCQNNDEPLHLKMLLAQQMGSVPASAEGMLAFSFLDVEQRIKAGNQSHITQVALLSAYETHLSSYLSAGVASNEDIAALQHVRDAISRTRSSAFDLTFSAPMSVSIGKPTAEPFGTGEGNVPSDGLRPIRR